jgi:hypothetical protein
MGLGGASGRRAAEQLREAPTCGRRLKMLDEFPLRRMEGGPRPSPEVDWAWRRLLATAGAVPIGRIACARHARRPDRRSPRPPLAVPRRLLV